MKDLIRGKSLTESMLTLLAGLYRAGGTLTLEATGHIDGHPMNYISDTREIYRFPTIRSWALRGLIHYRGTSARYTVTLTQDGVKLCAWLADAFAGWYDAGTAKKAS